MRAIPIDLHPFRFGDEHDRAQVAAALDAASTSSGFVSITGHGVAPELIERMLAVTTAFFDLDVAAKMTSYVDDRAANRGYAPLGSEALAYSLGEADVPPDLFEAFNIGREIGEHDVDDYVAAVRDTFFAPNVWPEQPHDFRATWLEYWAEMERVASTVMQAAAVALGLDQQYFTPMIDRSISVMRAINYQRSPDAPPVLPDQMGMGAHTDYGSITILLADPVPGLQLLDDDGVWHDVLPPEDGFIVNIGDLLAEWTNDRWRSTMHRVVPPSTESGGPARRRSIAWFQQPNWDAEIRCLPSCTDEDHPARYAPVRSGDHLLAKLLGPRLMRPSEPTPTL